MFSNFNCFRCGKNSLLTDEVTGEQFCSKCGYVISEKLDASGQSFMNTFNEFYYSFSPTISDYEREIPLFKEAVKTIITPLITSLSLLNNVSMDSEAEVLGYGISLILLNVGMYFVSPAIVIWQIRKKF